jgi:transcription initiation factor TFIIIB Brf1 subunit/transcription initiation factor TFIIB
MSTKVLTTKMPKSKTISSTRTPKTTTSEKKREEPRSYPLQKREEEHVDEDIEFLMKQASSMFGSNNKDKSKDKNKCIHSSIINENGIDICVDCGENLNSETFDTEWRYYGDNSKSYDPTRCQYRKVQDKGIKKELEKMAFSREIIDKADYYYQKVTQGDIKRSLYRQGIMFACVYYSYKFYKKKITTVELDEIFKIGRRKMSKGLTYFKVRIPKDEIVDEEEDYVTAEDFIPKILEKWNVKESHVKHVVEIFKTLKDKSSLLNTSNPQSVASGIVYYYLKKLGIDITPGKFGKIVELSEITINRITNEVEDNLV